ncbi:MAG: hypothetical protein WCI46_11555 [Verrucomicrobiota bacterium]
MECSLTQKLLLHLVAAFITASILYSYRHFLNPILSDSFPH